MAARTAKSLIAHLNQYTTESSQLIIAFLRHERLLVLEKGRSASHCRMSP